MTILVIIALVALAYSLHRLYHATVDLGREDTLIELLGGKDE